MKRLPALFVLLPLAFACNGCQQKDVGGTGLVKLADRVYAMIANGPTAVEGLGANSGFIVGRNGVLVVDSRYTPALANDLLKAIRSVTDAPVTHVVNTHYHPDHVWGNAVFKAQGAVILACPGTREAIEKYSTAYLDYYRARSADTYELLRDVEVVAPDSVVNDNTEIDLGGVKVAFRCVGPAHTAGDCVVLVPKERIAFAGGLISNGYHPNMGDPGADFDNWIAALEKLADMRIRYIVPGQGAICREDALETEMKYIKELRLQCARSIIRMIPLQQAIASIAIPGAEGYLQPNILPFNVQAVYRHDIPAIVRPDFAFEMPADFQIVDGGGSASLGYIRWGGTMEEGTLEIEVQWKHTASREVIVQDIAEIVERYVEGQNRTMNISGSKRIDLGGEQAIASYGTWSYKKDTRLPGGGVWTWALTARDGMLYSIRLAVEAGFDARKEKLGMMELERIASTFKVMPRAS